MAHNIAGWRNFQFCLIYSGLTSLSAYCIGYIAICSLMEYPIYLYKCPRSDAFFKRGGGGGGATITDKKISSRVQWQWAIIAGELTILETNLKSEEIINFYLVFTDFHASVIKIAMFCCDFLYFS